MPQHASCEKRIRQSQKANARNRFYKATMRTEIKKVREMEDAEAAKAQLIRVYSILDKLAKKGIIHHRKAANQKSKLASFVNGLAS